MQNFPSPTRHEQLADPSNFIKGQLTLVLVNFDETVMVKFRDVERRRERSYHFIPILYFLLLKTPLPLKGF